MRVTVGYITFCDLYCFRRMVSDKWFIINATTGWKVQDIKVKVFIQTVNNCVSFAHSECNAFLFHPLSSKQIIIITVLSAAERIKSWQHKAIHWSMHWAGTHLLSDAVLQPRYCSGESVFMLHIIASASLQRFLTTSRNTSRVGWLRFSPIAAVAFGCQYCHCNVYFLAWLVLVCQTFTYLLTYLRRSYVLL